MVTSTNEAMHVASCITPIIMNKNRTVAVTSVLLLMVALLLTIMAVPTVASEYADKQGVRSMLWSMPTVRHSMVRLLHSYSVYISDVRSLQAVLPLNY